MRLGTFGVTAVLAVIVAALAISSCGHGEPTAGISESMAVGKSRVARASGGSTVVRVRITGYAFDPPKVTVRIGSTVVFENDDSTEHTASAESGSFDTGTIARHQHRSLVVQDVGPQTYHCDFHPFMKAEIDVVAR